MTVLILTYYWPPAGGPGVQRILKFAKYLPEFGIRPVILTVKNGEYPARDETLIQDVPPEMPVHQTFSLEPYALYRRFSGQTGNDPIPTYVLTESSHSLSKRLAALIRANLFIPDARIGWLPYALQAAKRLSRTYSFDAVISTAPPMSTHLSAAAIAKQLNCRWVADFRDPWTDVFYYHALKRSRLAQGLDRWLERRVLRAADAVVTVSPSIIRLFRSKTDNDYHLIPNGYDRTAFAPVAPLPPDGKFHILHAGHLADNQNPAALWKALATLCRQSTELADTLQIDLYGGIHQRVSDDLTANGLSKQVVYHGYQPHHRIIAAYKQADLLFFAVPDCRHNSGILTSKLFDYLGADTPILGIGPETGDAASILKRTHAGRVFDYRAHDALANWLLKLFKGKNSLKRRHIEDYERKHLTGKLAKIVRG
ncbi:MAG: glycosyltransferase family 4 protein [candidate division KSB1 bacterium]|nr:glycosyltransferase family 4 protein [candidate division KSB1 bacterium]